MEQLDVNRVRATLASALAADAAPGIATLVYARAREAVRLLVAETKLAAEFEALFPAAYLELGAAPGYPETLCRQLEAWLAEVEAAREARALTPELALVDASLRNGDAEPEPDPGPEHRRAARVGGPPGVNTPVGVAAAAYFLRASARTLAIDVAFLLALAALVLVLSLHH